MDCFFLGDCRIRPSERIVERNGEMLRIEPRSMNLLVMLAEQAGKVVTRQEIEDRLWDGRVVGYEALTQTVAKLRRALGDDAHEPRFLLTIPKGGYKLVVAPEPCEAGDATGELPEPETPPETMTPVRDSNVAFRPSRFVRRVGSWVS